MYAFEFMSDCDLLLLLRSASAFCSSALDTHACSPQHTTDQLGLPPLPSNRRRWREQVDSLALASSAAALHRKRPKSIGLASRRPLQPLQQQQLPRRLHRADTLQVLTNAQKAEHNSLLKCDAIATIAEPATEESGAAAHDEAPPQELRGKQSHTDDSGIPAPPVPPTPPTSPPSPASPAARCVTRTKLTAFCRVLSAASPQRKPRSMVPSLMQQIQDIRREIDTSFTLAFVARPAPKLSRQQQRPPSKKNEASWELAGLSLQVNRVIGEGSYGRVMSCRVPRLGGCCYAVKMDWKIAHLVWEALVHAELQRETTHRGQLCQYQRLFLAPQLLVVHSVTPAALRPHLPHHTIQLTDSHISLTEQDCALMLMQEANCGNLLDLMSVLRTQAMSPTEHETIVMMCAYQMLACLELLHTCGVVHADAKADNWSLVCRPPQEVADVDCCGCCETCQHLAAIWQYAGFSVALIDFGISKIERFDQGDDHATPVVYSGDTAVSGYQCPAMLAGEPWKYDTDLYGVACCIHELLFQTPLELETLERADGSTLYRPAAKLRRYWSTLLWSNLFETLLNVPDCTVPSKEVTAMKAQLAQELQERFSRHGLRLQACCRALVAGLKASHKKKTPAVARKKRQNND